MIEKLAQFGPSAQRAVRPLDERALRPSLPDRTTRIAWRGWGSGKKNVLLLHGGAGSWTHWIRSIDALDDAYTLWIPDLPGCGDSDDAAPPATYESIAQALARDLRDLIDTPEQLAIVGFSLGAQFALRLAHLCAARTTDLVLVGANLVDHTGRPARPLINWKKAATEAEVLAAMRNNLNVMMLADPANIDAQALELYTTDVVRSRMRISDLGEHQPLVNALAGIPAHIRVTGISGDADQVFHEVLSRQRESLRRFRPDAEFHLIENGGHWVMYEAADAFNEILRSTLAAGSSR